MVQEKCKFLVQLAVEAPDTKFFGIPATSAM
jgi:hypothetical protein